MYKDVQYSLQTFVQFAKEYTLKNKNAFEARLEKAENERQEQQKTISIKSNDSLKHSKK